MKNIKIKNLVLKVATFFAVAMSLSVLNGANGSNVAFAMEKNNIEERGHGTYSSINSDLYGYFDKNQHFDFDKVVVCARKVNKAVHEAVKLAERIGEKIKAREYGQQLEGIIRGENRNRKIRALFMPVLRKLSLVDKYISETIKALEKSGFCEYVDKLCELESKSSDEVYFEEYVKLKNKVLEIARIMFAGFDVHRGLMANGSFSVKGRAGLEEYIRGIFNNNFDLEELHSCNKRIEYKLEKLYNKFFVYGVLGADYSELEDLQS